ncbi:MAG: hypothetical protein HGA85_04775 [Nanoarchaeota archaeon]|nr:hypothetical protein [Nanoarchaeota archaeon]
MRKNNIMFLFAILCLLQLVSAATDNTKSLQVTLVSQTPDPATAGQNVELRFMAENLGGADINGIKIDFVPTFPFTKIAGEEYTKTISVLPGYYQGSNAMIFKFTAAVDRGAVEGTNQAKLNLAYDDISYSNYFDVDVSGQKFAQIIFIDKAVLIPGRLDTLKFTIKNVGSAPLKDLTFSWVNDDKIILPVGSDNTKYIKYIDVDESEDIEYQVIADTGADAGIYELALTLAYDDQLTGTEVTSETIAGVYVGGGTDFDIAFSESTTDSVSFTVANVGSNPATSVSVIVPQQQGWAVSGSNSAIIGNLNTGDYTVASFSLKQDSTGMAQRNMTRQSNLTRAAAQQNALRIQIAYTDTMGKRDTLEKTVAMSAQSDASQAQGIAGTATGTGYSDFRRMRQESFIEKYQNYIIGVGIILLLAAILVMRARYRKLKLIDPEAKFSDIFRKKSKIKAR